jgi:hypothetical protein
LDALKFFYIKSHAKTQRRQVYEKQKSGIIQNILCGFASLRENQSSLIDKIKSRSKRNKLLEFAISLCGFQRYQSGDRRAVEVRGDTTGF